MLQAAGLLFFAFAGYARIATLGEEVRDPARTIPRAIPTALGIALVVYVAVSVAVLSVLGSGGLGHATAPLADAVRAAGVPGLVPVVRAGAAVAALGSLLALILGVSRTTLAMARDRHLPGALAAVHPRFEVPHRAELAVGAVVAVLAATVDVRGAIGFSSFGVLAYYAMANASAWTLSSAPASRVVPAVGLLGCVTLAFALPGVSVVVGAGVLGLGAAAYGVRRWWSASRSSAGPHGCTELTELSSATRAGAGGVCRRTYAELGPGLQVRIVAGLLVPARAVEPGVQPLREARGVGVPRVVGVVGVRLEEQDGAFRCAAVHARVHPAAPVGYRQNGLGPGPVRVLAGLLAVGEVLGDDRRLTGGRAVEQGQQAVGRAESAVSYPEIERGEERRQREAEGGLGTVERGRVHGGGQ